MSRRSEVAKGSLVEQLGALLLLLEDSMRCQSMPQYNLQDCATSPPTSIYLYFCEKKVFCAH